MLPTVSAPTYRPTEWIASRQGLGTGGDDAAALQTLLALSPKPIVIDVDLTFATSLLLSSGARVRGCKGTSSRPVVKIGANIGGAAIRRLFGTSGDSQADIRFDDVILDGNCRQNFDPTQPYSVNSAQTLNYASLTGGALGLIATGKWFNGLYLQRVHFQNAPTYFLNTASTIDQYTTDVYLDCCTGQASGMFDPTNSTNGWFCYQTRGLRCWGGWLKETTDDALAAISYYAKWPSPHTVANCSMSSSSAVVTAAVAPSPTWNAGDLVSVPGAGPSGVTLTGIVQSKTSTTATLNVAATTAVSGQTATYGAPGDTTLNYCKDWHVWDMDFDAGDAQTSTGGTGSALCLTGSDHHAHDITIRGYGNVSGGAFRAQHTLSDPAETPAKDLNLHDFTIRDAGVNAVVMNAFRVDMHDFAVRPGVNALACSDAAYRFSDSSIAAASGVPDTIPTEKGTLKHTNLRVRKAGAQGYIYTLISQERVVLTAVEADSCAGIGISILLPATSGVLKELTLKNSIGNNSSGTSKNGINIEGADGSTVGYVDVLTIDFPVATGNTGNGLTVTSRVHPNTRAFIRHPEQVQANTGNDFSIGNWDGQSTKVLYRGMRRLAPPSQGAYPVWPGYGTFSTAQVSVQDAVMYVSGGTITDITVRMDSNLDAAGQALGITGGMVDMPYSAAYKIDGSGADPNIAWRPRTG